MRFPEPLRPGDTIGVTAPSSGVETRLRPRLDHAVAGLRERGYAVRVGECLGADRVVSAPKAQRAAELMSMLRDPEVRAVVPPWGGELGIDLIDQLDWDELATLDPTWVVGYSDTCSVMLPLTTRLGWGTLHGSNLMDTPYAAPEGLAHWTEIAAAPGPDRVFTQRGVGRHRTGGWDDWEVDPAVAELTLDGEGSWRLLDGGAVDVTGRLVGGCIEILSQLAGTPAGDVPAYGREHSEDGLIVFLEAAGDDSYTIARALHGLRLAGWFDEATAILIGRTQAPGHDGFTQYDAVRDALGALDLPVVLDVECGHVPPFMPLVNGARARVVVDPKRHEITQTLG